MKASYAKYELNFKRPSGTSRGVLHIKETWFLKIENEDKVGVGECAIFRGLGIDDRPDYKEKLQWVVDNIFLGKDRLWDELRDFPSIQFGVEQAFLSLESNNPFILFPSLFTEGTASIPINGLVWMGDEDFMKSQIDEKIKEGFSCVKLKIGAIDFNLEIRLLSYIREQFSPQEMELRVDANGGFSVIEALDKLLILSEFQIHSIEQPIKQRQYDSMAELCKNTPLPIALDEELIGVVNYSDKENLLKHIRPQFIILKPSLVGGFKGSMEWIEIANRLGIGWWITSALESNIGLNAISQWTFTLQSAMLQGLGTGGLYTNNFDSPLEVCQGALWYNSTLSWDFDLNKLAFEN